MAKQTIFTTGDTMKTKIYLALMLFLAAIPLARGQTLVTSGFSSGFTSVTTGNTSLTAVAGAPMASDPQGGLSSGFMTQLGSSALYVGFDNSSVAGTAAVHSVIPVSITPRRLGTGGTAKIYYRAGGSAAFAFLTMTGNSDGSYSGQIPAITARGVDFYLEVTDSVPKTARDPGGAPAQWYSVGATF
jgi:hypothetical protein